MSRRSSGMLRRLVRTGVAWTAVLGLVPAGMAGQASPGPQEVRDERLDSLEELAARAVRAVVLIDVRTPSDSRQGSGFLVDPSGRILTNHHVVRDARTVRVKLSSGDVYDQVTILAADPRRDIAVLQVAGFDLPALPLGNSDSLRIGAPVVLIGSPLGLENTVTTGIVSGRRQEPEGFQRIQISAPASQGSSGGPVLARNGEVVGIATAQMRTGQNLNFAVPINYARGLLTHLNGEPVAVLPSPARLPEEPAPMAARSNVVNRGLGFDLSDFAGYSVESRADIGDDRSRRIRVTYRLIQTVGGEDPRIERYFESETTRRTEPFGTEQTIRRERRRTLVLADGLRPLSARGEVAWWTGEEWQTAEYDLRFDDYRVQGFVADTTGNRNELDRELPDGVVLREMRDLAFGTLASDSLVGQSVELVTFDPMTAELTHDRYDVMEATEIRVGGEDYPALRVNVATGLTNVDAWFRTQRPRILLRQQSADGPEVEEVVRLEVLPRPSLR